MLRLERIDAGYGTLPHVKGASVRFLIDSTDALVRRSLPRLVDVGVYRRLMDWLPGDFGRPRYTPSSFAQVTQVLWDVSLEVRDRSMTVIIGPNGAGKSTLLRVITGLLAPTRGRILLGETDITSVPAYARPELGIASCPEGRRLFPQLTTEANLRLGAYSKRARASMGDTLEYVYGLFPRLRERARVKAGRLSGGEQQMVGIGRALMAKPSMLILDEPSLGLAPIVVTEIFEKIHRLREAGLTILLVEQNAFQALRIADFGYIVQHGRIVREGEPSKLLNLEQLRKDYFAIG